MGGGRGEGRRGKVCECVCMGAGERETCPPMSHLLFDGLGPPIAFVDWHARLLGLSHKDGWVNASHHRLHVTSWRMHWSEFNKEVSASPELTWVSRSPLSVVHT